MNEPAPRGAYITKKMLRDQIRELSAEVAGFRRENMLLKEEIKRLKRDSKMASDQRRRA